MRVSVAVALIYLPVTACQCIDVLHDEKRCMKAMGPYRSNETPLGCMELCLSQNNDRCLYVQWHVQTKGCFLSRTRPDFSSIGDCITIKKRSCVQIYDLMCFEPSSGNVYEGKGELTGLTQEEECKTLCMFMDSCQAYTWFARTSRCRIHRTTMPSEERLQAGDVQSRKLSRCPKGRCVTLRASTFSYDGHREELLGSIGECMARSLNTTRVGEVDWNTNDFSCWSHANRDLEGVVSEDEKIIQLLKPYHCKMIRRSVCMKKRKDAGMSDGYIIARVNEEDCVSLCYVVANCAAVELDGNGCVFHFVKKEIKHKEGHTLYVSCHCSDQAESTSVPTTSLVTPPTTPQRTTMMSSDAEQNAGTFRWSYYTSHSGYTETAMRRTCLECALLCHRNNCTGFSCEENTSDDGCKVKVKGDPMFSRTRQHSELGFQQRN